MLKKITHYLIGIGLGFTITAATEVKATQSDIDDLTSIVQDESESLSKLHFDIFNPNNISLNIPWNQPSVQFWIEYYKQPWNRLKLSQQVNKLKLFLPEIKEIFKEEGLPDDLALLPIIESGCNPSAVSRAGAAGLWQLMPSTARLFGLKVNSYIDERFDFEKSTRAAAKYLKHLYSKFGRWDLAIAAYNAGPKKIENLIAKGEASKFWDLTRVPDETLNYVPKFYAVISLVKAGNYFENRKTDFALLKIKALSKMRLYSISKKLNVPYYILKLYNRQYKRRIVPKNYYVYIPSNFVRERSVLKEIMKSKVFVYRPVRTERLSYIAKKFGVNEEIVKKINRLKRNVVYRGQVLLIVSSEYALNENIIEKTAV